MQEVGTSITEATQDTVHVQVDLPQRAGADNRKGFWKRCRRRWESVRWCFWFCVLRTEALFPSFFPSWCCFCRLFSILCFPLITAYLMALLFFIIIFIHILRSISICCCIFSENSQILILGSLTLESSKARSQDSCQTIIESQQQYEMKIMICEGAL